MSKLNIILKTTKYALIVATDWFSKNPIVISHGKRLKLLKQTSKKIAEQCIRSAIFVNRNC